MIKKSAVFCLFLAVLALAGCYDNFDLEDRLLVTAMAVDYSQGEGYEVILSLPELEKEEEPQRELKRAKGLNIKEALRMIEGSSSKKLYFGQMKAVIMGEGLLKNEIALKELTEYLEENPQIDKNVFLAAASEIGEVMEAEPKEEGLTGFYISGFYDSGNDGKTFVNKENLLDFLRDNAENKSAALPFISAKNGEPCFLGIAIIKNNALGGILRGNEAYGFMWLSKRGYNGTLSAGMPPVSTEITEKETEYEFYEEDGKIKLAIKIDAIGNMWNYTDDEIKSKGSEYLKEFKGEIKTQAESALKRLNAMDCDALGLEERLKESCGRLYREKGESFNPSETEIYVNFSMNFV